MSELEQPTIHAVPASSIQTNLPKSTITKKRNPKAKKGLGTKKLGSQKVSKADFALLEKNAEEADKSAINSNLGHERKHSSSVENTESVRLAYQDISNKEKNDNMKLDKMESTKKHQAERLGMGMGKTEDVSHMLSMVTIDQINPIKSSRKGRYKHEEDTFYDSFSSKSRKNRWDESESDSDSEFKSSSRTRSDFSYSGSKVDKDAQSYNTIIPIETHMHSGNNKFSTKTAEPKNNRQRNVKQNSSPEESMADRFKGAKSISSDMMFGDNNKDSFNQSNYRKFEGSSSISSDAYFGRSTSRPSNHVPGVHEVRDGVKEGVRSVAGKLSTLASGLANTIQDRYG